MSQWKGVQRWLVSDLAAAALGWERNVRPDSARWLERNGYLEYDKLGEAQVTQDGLELLDGFTDHYSLNGAEFWFDFRNKQRVGTERRLR